jgi:alpha-L-rhamnosidase
MEWIVEEAIMLTGQYDKGLLRMRQRHESQVSDKNLTTMYERFPNDPRGNLGTPNHAWNAPNYVLSRYIAGIAATDVAWSKFEVKPNLAHLTHVKQIVPSVKGDILLEVHKTNDSYNLRLNAPSETIATVYIPAKRA